MVHRTTDPAEFPVDRLLAVREWLWRHSSQPNGDPWDSDPEHLDQTARNLLDDLAQWLFATGSPTSAAEQDPERTRDRRDVASPTAALPVIHHRPEPGRRPSTAPSHTSTPASTA
jgi:hypothetical protein